MIKLNPNSKLNVNTSHLMNLKLPHIDINITNEQSEPDVKRIVVIEHKTISNNFELF